MTAPATRSGLSWSARLLIALSLILLGGAAAAWALARYDRAAVLLGVAPAAPAPIPRPQPVVPAATAAPAPMPADLAATRIAELEARLARVENATQRAEGSAGRADALVVAFAARRALDRGVALGYLEGLLVDRFGREHPRAVATIVTASRSPVRLDQLRAEYDALRPELRGTGPGENWWAGLRREFGSLVEIRRADRPSTKPDARFERARDRLAIGDVDAALAETMRMPGAARASAWVARARRYVAAQRALEEIESSALLVGAPGR
jgi:hypothetical protein